jgi:transcriptional regulator NrdR family protein
MNGIDKRVRKACAGCGHKFTIYELYGSEYKRLHKIEKTIAKILSLMEVLKNIENEDN